MFMAMDFSFTMGLSSSVPKRDHVPLERKAKSPLSLGTAVIALWVSWPHTEITFTGLIPHSSHTSLRISPRGVPEGTISQRREDGIPRRSSRSVAQFFVFRSTICDVVAMEYSVVFLPVRR